MDEERRRRNLIELMSDGNPEVAAPPEEAATSWWGLRSALRTSSHAARNCMNLIGVLNAGRSKRSGTTSTLAARNWEKQL